MDPLFPALPENLADLSDEDLSALLDEHNTAADLIDKNDEDFIKGMAAEQVIAEYEAGVEQIEQIRAEQEARAEAERAFQEKLQSLSAKRRGAADDDTPEDGDESGDDGEGDEPQAAAADDDTEEPEAVEDREPALVAAAVETAANGNGRMLRRPPKPSAEREAGKQPVTLVAAAGLSEVRAGKPLGRIELATAMKKEAIRRGKPTKSERGVEERILVAAADFPFPENRILTDDQTRNAELIRQIVPESVPGMVGSQALVASGGLCAPLEPIYTMPNYASEARPVRDALASFRADRGGVNVPEATYIGDITTAISTITEEDDAAGGTFATKSCQALECPDYTEVPVTVISHCREYGNLNARAWPEKIAHENALTMAAHARTAETYLLSRIKDLSVNVTNGVETLGALIYLVDGIVKSSFGIRGRMRMSPNARLQVLLPFYTTDLLLLDTIQTQFDRFKSKADITAYLRGFGIDVSYYLDTPDTDDSQIPDASQAAGALDGFPNTVQWAIFPVGGFIHVDSGALELGIVRDSTLNSTNDFQIFGETFENVARLAPQQATYWVTTDWCPTGQFPPAGTARTCE